MPNPETLLKIQLKFVGVTQPMAANKIGVPTSTLSSWLCGTAPLPLEKRVALELVIAETYLLRKRVEK